MSVRDLFSRINRPTELVWVELVWVLGAMVGLLLFVAISWPAIWYDEAYQWLVWNLSLPDVVRAAQFDYWPPLWFLWWQPVVQWFGSSLFVLRLPSIISAVALVPLVYIVAKDHSPGAGSAAIFVAASPYTIWLATDARGYATHAALYLLLWITAHRLTRSDWWAVGFAVVVALMLWLHPISPLYLLPTGIYWAWRYRKDGRAWVRLVVASIAGSLTFLPWLPTLFSQAGSDFWIDPNSANLINMLGALSLTWGAMSGVLSQVAMLGVILLFIVVGLWRVRSDSTSTLLLVMWGGPFLTMVLVSYLLTPVVYYRVLSALAAPMLLWMVHTVVSTGNQYVKVGLAAALVVVAGWGFLNYSAETKDGGLLTVTDHLTEQANGDIVLHATATTMLPFMYHSPDLDHRLLETARSPRYWLAKETAEMAALPMMELNDAIAHLQTGGIVWIVYNADLSIRQYREPEQLIRQLQAETGEYWEPAGEVNYWQAATIYTYKINGIGEMPNSLGPKPLESVP